MKTNAYWYNVYQKIAEKLFEISQKEFKPGEYLYDKLTKDIPPKNIEFHLSRIYPNAGQCRFVTGLWHINKC